MLRYVIGEAVSQDAVSGTITWAIFDDSEIGRIFIRDGK